MARRLKGKAVIEVLWDEEIVEDSTRHNADEFREAAKDVVREALMDNAMAKEVVVKQIEMNITEEG